MDSVRENTESDHIEAENGEREPGRIRRGGRGKTESSREDRVGRQAEMQWMRVEGGRNNES